MDRDLLGYFETGRVDRSVTPVVSTILVVAIVLILASVIGATALGYTEKLGETSVATGEQRCVVDSVEFDPADVQGFADSLSTDCVLWFDASQAEYSDAESVDVWEDQSQNKYDLTSADGLSDPTYRSNVDGLAAIDFNDGSDAGLSTEINTSQADIVGDTTISVTILVRVQSGDSTIFQVGQPAVGGLKYFRFGYNDNSPYEPYPWYAYANADAVPAEAGFYGHDPVKTNSLNDWKVVTYIHDGGRLEAYVDGESRGGKDGQLDILDGSIQIGYETEPGGSINPTMNGQIAELVVFEQDLSDKERKTVECALDDKHGDVVSVAGC